MYGPENTRMCGFGGTIRIKKYLFDHSFYLFFFCNATLLNSCHVAILFFDENS